MLPWQFISLGKKMLTLDVRKQTQTVSRYVYYLKLNEETSNKKGNMVVSCYSEGCWTHLWCWCYVWQLFSVNGSILYLPFEIKLEDFKVGKEYCWHIGGCMCDVNIICGNSVTYEHWERFLFLFFYLFFVCKLLL